jgi:hypothetical protein
MFPLPAFDSHFNHGQQKAAPINLITQQET